MYFYDLGITKGVEDAEEPGIVEGAEGEYTMHVVSRDGSVDCTLTNVAPPTRGPTNTVDVSCASPQGFSGTSTTAVVNVTGP
jgi:hypothetical protein